jgi:hypothetical protein
MVAVGKCRVHDFMIGDICINRRSAICKGRSASRSAAPLTLKTQLLPFSQPQSLPFVSASVRWQAVDSEETVKDLLNANIGHAMTAALEHTACMICKEYVRKAERLL